MDSDGQRSIRDLIVDGRSFSFDQFAPLCNQVSLRLEPESLNLGCYIVFFRSLTLKEPLPILSQPYLFSMVLFARNLG
jgi:hypothetical protein